MGFSGCRISGTNVFVPLEEASCAGVERCPLPELCISPAYCLAARQHGRGLCLPDCVSKMGPMGLLLVPLLLSVEVGIVSKSIPF
eukprot:s160_g15.t1